MDNDFSNIFNKFNDILKDKNIDLNKVLNDEEQSSNPLDFEFDLDTIIKLKNILSKINDTNSPRNNLLNSLKPFLTDDKKQKLNQYIKIANLLNAFEVMNPEKSHKETKHDFALYVILVLLIAN